VGEHTFSFAQCELLAKCPVQTKPFCGQKNLDAFFKKREVCRSCFSTIELEKFPPSSYENKTRRKQTKRFHPGLIFRTVVSAEVGISREISRFILIFLRISRGNYFSKIFPGKFQFSPTL
jgi:hypothetical protein